MGWVKSFDAGNALGAADYVHDYPAGSDLAHSSDFTGTAHILLARFKLSLFFHDPLRDRLQPFQGRGWTTHPACLDPCFPEQPSGRIPFRVAPLKELDVLSLLLGMERSRTLHFSPGGGYSPAVPVGCQCGKVNNHGEVALPHSHFPHRLWLHPKEQRHKNILS